MLKWPLLFTHGEFDDNSGSSNGRTADSGSAYLGSNPSPEAKIIWSRRS